MLVKVTTKNVIKNIECENGFDAIKKFFFQIKSGKIRLEDLGIIGIWYRVDGEQIAFRIPPALFQAKIIDFVTYRATMENAGLFTNDSDLLMLSKKDKWMVE